MQRHLPLLFAVLVLTTAAPKPYYQQHYQYQEQSESYKNNELQHKKEEAGRYSKVDDGITKPVERKAFHHSEYHAPGSESTAGSNSQYQSSLHNQNGGIAIPDTANQHFSQAYSSGSNFGSQTVQQAVPTSYRREWSSQSGYSTIPSGGLPAGYQTGNSFGHSDSALRESSVSQTVTQHKEERVRGYSSTSHNDDLQQNQNYDTHNQGRGRGHYEHGRGHGYGHYKNRQTYGTSDSDITSGTQYGTDGTSGRVSDQRSHSYFNSGSDTNSQYGNDDTTQQNPGLRVYPAGQTKTGSERVTHQTSRAFSASQTTATNADGTAIYSVPQNSGITLVPVSQINPVPEDSGVRIVPSGHTTTGTTKSRRTYSSIQTGSNSNTYPLNTDDSTNIQYTGPQNPVNRRLVPASQINTDTTPQRIIPVDQLHTGSGTTSHQTSSSRQYSTYQTSGTGSTNLNTDDTDCDDTVPQNSPSGTYIAVPSSSSTNADRVSQSRRTYISGTTNTNTDDSLRPVGTGTIPQTGPSLPATSLRRVYKISGASSISESDNPSISPVVRPSGITDLPSQTSETTRTSQQASRSYTISQSNPSGTVPQNTDYRPSRGPVPYPGYRGLSTTESPIEPDEPIVGDNSQIPIADHTRGTTHQTSSRRTYQASGHSRTHSTTNQRPQNVDDLSQHNVDDDLTQKSLDVDLTQQTQTGFDNDDYNQQTPSQDATYTSRKTHRTYQRVEKTENQNNPTQYRPISTRPVSDNQLDGPQTSQAHRTSHRSYQQRVEKTEFADTPVTVTPRPQGYNPGFVPQTQTFDNTDSDLTHQTVDYSQQTQTGLSQHRDYSQNIDNTNQDTSQITGNSGRVPNTNSNQGTSYRSSSSYSSSSSHSTQQQQPQVVFSPVHVGSEGGKLQVYQTMQIPAGTSDEMRLQLEEQMRQQLEQKMQELYQQQSSHTSSSSTTSQSTFSPVHVGRTGSGQLQVYQTIAIPAGASEETRQRMQQEMRQNLEMKMRELMQQQGYQNIRHISTQPGTHVHSTGDGSSIDCDDQVGGSYSTSYSMSSSSSSASSTGSGIGGNHYSMKVRPGSTYAIHQPIGSSSYYKTQY